jgi:formate dehydrogenase major subunit
MVKLVNMVKLVIDGAGYDAEVGEHLVDVINRSGRELPQVCYHPQLGPIQT